jgi:hypothetical protein
VTCIKGSSLDTVARPCSRAAGEQAVVVSNTPTYSYGPGASSDTEQDATSIEQELVADHVSAVVSGRLGWNGLYYTLAAGVHAPCPGGAYPARPPDPGTQTPCTATQATPDPSSATSSLSAALQSLGAPAPPPDPTGTLDTGGVTGVIPNIVAASAGGQFGPMDAPQSGSASDGYWHGYTILRLAPGRAPIIEQRPVFDWVTLGAATHEISPGQHLQLHGFGREPVGGDQPIRYDDIQSAAITHRYDLVMADPARPWLPQVDPGSSAPNHYVPLDPSVGTVNQTTGFVQTGSGSHPRVYALAILSVGDQAASYPLVFEPRRSFVQRVPVLPQLPPVAPPLQVPPVHLAAAAPAPPPPPSSAPPTPPEVATPNLPQLPNLAAPPPVNPITPPSPPPPPAPPPPPNQPAPLPLALQAKLSPIGINATVVPPSPPPVNPAPPSGSAARKEAKQRQAATAKSEEGSVGEQTQQAGGDLVQGRTEPRDAFTRQPAEMSRRAVDRPVPSYTITTVRSQPSAWARDLGFGGGLIAAALLLAFCSTIVRPTPRGRAPRVPAPAFLLTRRRR